jgi:hypothetical protein
MPCMFTETRRDAELALRGPHEFVRPRLSWPPDAADDSPMAVFLGDADASFDVADALCLEAGFVVLAIRTPDVEVATIAMEWVADHGGQLGADPSRLLVAGGRFAAAAALHARDEGWPLLSRQLLIGPEVCGWPAAGRSLAGVAPATVINATHYASRLREAGVEVEELFLPEAMNFDWMRSLRSDDADAKESQSDH